MWASGTFYALGKRMKSGAIENMPSYEIDFAGSGEGAPVGLDQFVELKLLLLYKRVIIEKNILKY